MIFETRNKNIQNNRTANKITSLQLNILKKEKANNNKKVYHKNFPKCFDQTILNKIT